MKNTPWGIPEYERVLAEGIISYSTDRHGGIWLSPERQKELGYDKNWLHNAEWWEEDEDWSVPFSFFCKEIWVHNPKEGFDDILRQAINIVNTYHPDMLAVIQKKVSAYHSYKWDLTTKHGLKNVYLPPGFKPKITLKGGSARRLAMRGTKRQ